MGRESVLGSEKCVEINMHSEIVQCLHNLQQMPKNLFDACEFSLLLHKSLYLDSIKAHQGILKQCFWSTNLTLYMEQQVVLQF